MSDLTIGQHAPDFRLPVAQGGELGPAEYQGRSNLILFFAKGMACGFCRQKMSQLARGLPRFRALATEVVQITPTPVERGRFYARNFQLPFPYLCDPDYRVYAAYGMTVREHSLLWKVRVARHARQMPPPETEFGNPKQTLPELGQVLNDDDLGFFVLDRDGVVRHATSGQYIAFDGVKPIGAHAIPSNDEIVAVLERCDGRAEERKPA
jgi:peroxiredoxin